MTNAGTAHMGIGEARGENRAEHAAEMAINSSLLETSITGAKGILLNVSGGDDLSLFEVNEVAQAVTAAADPEANIIFGAVVDPLLNDILRVTVVAAGFSGDAADRAQSAGDGVEAQVGPQDVGTAPEARADADAGQEGGGAEGRGAVEPEPEAPRTGADSRGWEDDLELPPFLRR